MLAVPKTDKSARQYFYAISLSFWDILSCNTSLLVRSKNLGLFANTMTVDDKYSRHIKENLPQPIQM